jgi:predicted DNA-binding transcriptional regulator AlpA
MHSTSEIELAKEMQMETTIREDTLLAVHEVAQILKVPPSWVYEHTRERYSDRISGFRLGKYWRSTEADVLAWLAARCGPE